MTSTGSPPTLAPKTPPQRPQRRRLHLPGAALLSALLLLTGCAAGGESPKPTTSQSSSPSTATTPSSTQPSSPSTTASPTTASPTIAKPSATKTPPQSASGTPGTKPSGNPSGKQPKTLPANNVLVVVNKHTPLSPLEYAPTDLVNVGNGQQLRSAAATAYQQLVAGASAAGYNLAASSGYRSYATQVQTHNHWRNQYGAEYAERISAKPGYSEHQTGLAIDVMPASGQCRLEVCFGTLPEGKWVAANAHKYGFIIRYPQGQEAVTGYSYEPWHLRYVGVEAATSISAAGKTMEAFYGYPAAPTYR